MIIPSDIFELRIELQKAITRLRKGSEYCCDKKAFKIALERLKKNKIDIGLNDDPDKAYHAFIMFKKRNKKYF